MQAKAFSEMLEDAVAKYQNRAIQSAEVIDELIKLAKEMRAAQSRGVSLGLSDDELAFYDALADNESARDVMGDEQLGFLAQALAERVKRNVSIDWQVRESARARTRIGQTPAAPIRLPARHAEARHRAGAGAGRSVVQRMGERVVGHRTTMAMNLPAGF